MNLFYLIIFLTQKIDILTGVRRRSKPTVSTDRPLCTIRTEVSNSFTTGQGFIFSLCDFGNHINKGCQGHFCHRPHCS